MIIFPSNRKDRRGRDRMDVGFTPTYAISANHHQSCEFESRSWRGLHQHAVFLRASVMAFNATFKNISATSWLSALLAEETGVPGENHRPAVSH
jgi:hypothetical protein